MRPRGGWVRASPASGAGPAAWLPRVLVPPWGLWLHAHVAFPGCTLGAHPPSDKDPGPVSEATTPGPHAWPSPLPGLCSQRRSHSEVLGCWDFGISFGGPRVQLRTHIILTLPHPNQVTAPAPPHPAASHSGTPHPRPHPAHLDPDACCGCHVGDHLLSTCTPPPPHPAARGQAWDCAVHRVLAA